MRELLADYVAGTLKIQSKGACNRKVSLSDRLRVLFFHAMHTPHGEHWTPKTVHEIAAEEGKEPIEIRQRLAKAERDFQTAWAKRLGVSPATIRAIIKPLTAKKK